MSLVMKINRTKTELALARACMSTVECARKAKIKYPTLRNLLKGGHGRPKTIGSIARALGVDVLDIIEL